jgi:hypothetical protein
MKHIGYLVLITAIGLSACRRGEDRAPAAALDACRSTKALMAIRRAVLQEAATEGASAVLVGRLKREARVTLESPEVRDYDDDTQVVGCAAQLVLTPPGPAGRTASSRVAYDAEPLRSGKGYRFRITDMGQMVSAIASLGPLPPEPAPPPASSAAAEAAASAPSSSAEIDPLVREDAAAAGDTGRTHRPPVAVPAQPQHP